jgi:hypothetical protein
MLPLVAVGLLLLMFAPAAFRSMADAADWLRPPSPANPTAQAQPASRALANPGPCVSGQPQLVIAVLDVSDSVIAENGADPDGRSFDESQKLARHLAAHSCTAADRFGAVIFADGVVEFEPTPLTSLSIIEAALRRPPASEIGSGTRLDSAMQAAWAMGNRFPNHDATVVVLTDAQVDNPDDTGAALAQMDESRLHLVALGQHDALFDSMFRTVNDLGQAAPGEVAQALNEAITDSRTHG